MPKHNLHFPILLLSWLVAFAQTAISQTAVSASDATEKCVENTGDSQSWTLPISTPSNGTVTAGSVNIDFDLYHSWKNDVTITLCAPSGFPCATIKTDGLGGSNDLGNTDGSDYAIPATYTIQDGTSNGNLDPGNYSAPGSYDPATPFSIFNGINSDGDWILTLDDDGIGDDGCIKNVTLNLQYDIPCIAPTYSTSIVNDCGNGQFQVNVIVNSLGDGTTVEITDGTNTNTAAAGDLEVTTFIFPSPSTYYTANETLTFNALDAGLAIVCSTSENVNSPCNGGDICAEAVNILGMSSPGDLSAANDELGVPAGQFIYDYNNTSRIFMCDPSFNTSGSWSDNKDLWYVIDIPDGANEFTVSFTGLTCDVFVLPYSGTCGNLTEMPIGNDDSVGSGNPCFSGAENGITNGFPIANSASPSITFKDNTGGTCTTIEDASTSPIYLKVVGYGGHNGTASPMPCATVPACDFTIIASAPQQNDECSTAVDATKNYTGSIQTGDFTQASDESAYPNPTTCEGQNITTDGLDLWFIANLPPDNDTGNIGELDVIVTASNTTDEIYVEIYDFCAGNVEDCLILNGTDGYTDLFESTSTGGWWGNQADATDSPSYLRVLSNGGNTFNFCAEVVAKNNACERLGVLEYDPTFSTQVGDFQWTSLNGDGTRDLWYQLFSSTSKELDVTLNLPAGQTASVEIYEDDCDNLVLAGSETNFTGNSTQRLGCLETGTNYYIRVVLTGGAATAGTFTLDVLRLSGVPINDECSAAQVDTDYEITSMAQSGNLPLGTPCGLPQAACDTGDQGEDLWYWFTLPGNPCTDDLSTTNLATIDYDLNGQEAYLMIYDGNSCSNLPAEDCTTISGAGSYTFDALNNTGFDSKKLVRIVQKNDNNPVANFTLGPVTFGESPCNDHVDDAYEITSINSGSNYSTCFNGPFNATGATSTTGTNNNVWFEFTAPDNADEEGYVSIYVQSLSSDLTVPYILDIQVYEEVGGVGGISQVGSGSTNTDGDGWVDLGHLTPGEDYFIEIGHNQSATTEVLYDLCIYDSPTQVVDCPETNFPINIADGVHCGDLANDCGLYYRIEIPANTPSAWYSFEAIGNGIPLDIRVYGQGSDSPSGDGNATDYDQPCNPMLANIIPTGPTGASTMTDVDACTGGIAGSAGEYATYNLIGGSGLESNYYYLEVRHGSNADSGCDMTAADICSITMAGPFTTAGGAETGGTPDGTCSGCAISAVSAIGTSSCDAASSTYTLDLVVYYSQAPEIGTLDINGQSFAITGSPQTISLAGLPADGNLVNLAINFSDNPSCILDLSNFFTAPDGCLPECEISSIEAGTTQTTCSETTNTYDQEVIITYANAPASGTLMVNGQSFVITSSPQTVTLTGLIADGNPVNIVANFSDENTCSLNANSVFTAPEPCFCLISGLTTGLIQTTCDPSTNSYEQQIVVSYDNAPSTGTLIVNGQSFAITSSPQLVTLTGLIANGNPVDVTASFSANTACTFSESDLFDAPENCNCSIENIELGAVQSACNPSTNTYSQELIISYTDAPSTGTLDVNGQSFGITNSPQTITLTGLPANGNIVNVIANFSSNTSCSLTANSVFTAPEDCVTCDIVGSITPVSQSPCITSLNTYTQTLEIAYSNPPATGTLDVNGQSFVITASPQLVTLIDLVADSNPVNVSVSFSADPSCTLSANAVFTAPDNCLQCSFNGMTAGAQSDCDPNAGNTYTQEITVQYINPPTTGTLDVNGQSFAITESPQTVLLTLPADGNPVTVTARFSDDLFCVLNSPSLFVAPGSCEPVCGITSVAVGTQTPCDALNSTYSQELLVTYENAPATGLLYINGQAFPLTSSPQSVTLAGLIPNGGNVNIFAAFTSNTGCNYIANNVFTAPTECFSCSDGIQNGEETGIDCGGPDCPPCAPLCTLSQYYSGALFSGVYQTAQTIGSNALIINTENVSLLAGCINLDAGFDVQLGAEFLADPVPCQAITGDAPMALNSIPNLQVTQPTAQNLIFNYHLIQSSKVQVSIQNMDGTSIRTIIPPTKQMQGLHAQQVALGQLENGIYLLVMETNSGTFVEKIVVSK